VPFGTGLAMSYFEQTVPPHLCDFVVAHESPQPQEQERGNTTLRGDPDWGGSE
jgi:hypothetical protein